MIHPSLNQGQVELLLLEIEKRNRLPPGVRQRLTDTYNGDKDSTERIFLDYGGLPACAAYIFTKYIVEDISGKKPRKLARKKLLTTLEQLSVTDRQAAANQLKAALKPDAKRIERWIKKSHKRAIEKYRIKISSDGAGFEQSEGDSDLGDPHDRNSSLLPPPLRSNEPAHQTSDEESSPQSLQQDVLHENDRSWRMDEASITACTLLFPEYLAGAIMRQSKLDGATAAVSITPTQDDRVASLNIDVTPKRIENIARELFGVYLENEAGLRYTYIGQTRLIPTQEVVLKGCRLGPIPTIFGNMLTEAVVSSPGYKKERLMEDECTACISMAVSRAADKCARVVVLIPLEQAIVIKQILSQVA